jgi:hypothetical protein
MTAEQLEGYLKRLGLKYRVGAEHGDDGLIHVGFATRWYRCVLPPRTKHLEMIVMLTTGGSLLTVAAPFCYHMRQAKKPAAFHEYLMALNYQLIHAQFQLDRRDGEIRCCAHVPVAGSNLSLDAFQKLLYSIPMLVDVNHRQTRSVLRTGRLPPAPKPPEFFTRLLEELAHRAGSVENLRKIVEEHKDSATKAVRKRKNEICNKLPEDAAATGPAPQAAAPAEGTAPAAQASDGDATTAPGDNAGNQEPATDADPPVPEAGPDEPLA